MSFEQLLKQLPDGFDKLSDADVVKTLATFMKEAYGAMKAEEAKQAVRDEYEAKREKIEEEKNKDLTALQEEYGERLK